MRKLSIAWYTGGGGVRNLKVDKGKHQNEFSSNFSPNQSFLYQGKIILKIK